MIIDVVVFLVLLSLGYGFGQMAEKRHYRSILAREKLLRRIPAIASKHPPTDIEPPSSQLVSGNVVISIDYFKRFIAALRNFFGGRVTSYESLLDRARREAILRMKEQAARRGANMIFNIKIETSSISKGQRQTVGAVEVLAYGTALIPPR